MLLNNAKPIKTTLLIAGLLISGLLGYYTYAASGLGNRLPGFEFEKYAQLRWQEPFNLYGSAQEFIDECDSIYAKDGNHIARQCFTKNPAKANQVFLWGDSYAQMLTYGLIKNLPINWQLLQVASRGCQPSIFETQDSDSNYCKKSNYFALKTIQEIKPSVVVISQNSNLTKENAELFSKKLHQLGVHKVIFVGKPPEWSRPLPQLVFRLLPRPTPAYTKVGLVEELQLQAGNYSSTSLGLNNADVYLNLIELFCTPAGGCNIFIGDRPDAGITALDDRHLTPAASDFLSAKALVPEILKSKE